MKCHQLQFTEEMLDSLFRYAKFQYECGNYSAASLCLDYYRNIVPQQNPNYLSALYGKLASEILLQVCLRGILELFPLFTVWDS